MESLEEIKRQHVLKTLKHFGYNRTKAAKSLGLSLRCVRYLCKKYSVQEPDVKMPKAVEKWLYENRNKFKILVAK